MSTAKLPTLAIPADLHARLTAEAARRDCRPTDLVAGVLRELVERLAAEEIRHAPTRFCRCGGPGCARAVEAPAPLPCHIVDGYCRAHGRVIGPGPCPLAPEGGR